MEHPRGHPRAVFASVAAICLVQSGLLMAGAIIGILTYQCDIFKEEDALEDISKDEFQLIYMYYFSNQKCQKNFKISNSTYRIENINPAAKRTVGVLYTYSVLGGLWLVGSLLLLVSAIREKNIGLTMGKYMHYFWAASLTIVLALDIITTILYLIDLAFTSNSEDLLKLIGMENLNMEKNIPVKKDIPPIIMAIFFSKGVVLWIMNLVFLIVVNKNAKQLNMMRKRTEFIQAHVTTMPVYMLPPEIIKNAPPTDKSTNSTDTVMALPRLVTRDGVSDQRPTPLQIAAMQGFSYERPPEPNGIQRLSTTTDGPFRWSVGPTNRPKSTSPPNMLRNQLPWSYFDSRDNPANIHPPSRHSHWAPPAEPTPDYTPHFHRSYPYESN